MATLFETLLPTEKSASSVSFCPVWSSDFESQTSRPHLKRFLSVLKNQCRKTFRVSLFEQNSADSPRGLFFCVVLVRHAPVTMRRSKHAGPPAAVKSIKSFQQEDSGLMTCHPSLFSFVPSVQLVPSYRFSLDCEFLIFYPPPQFLPIFHDGSLFQPPQCSANPV